MDTNITAIQADRWVDQMKRCCVFGAGGFIGWHLAKRLKEEGNFVAGIDLKFSEFDKFVGDHFQIADLRDRDTIADVMGGEYDEVFQLAADMGGAGFIFTGVHDSEIITGNALININTALNAHKVGRVFYSSSACVYGPHLNFKEDFKEENAYPAFPDSQYGWEKLFSERVYLSLKKAVVRIARFHNIFGTEGAWKGGREKSPAAICRKVAQAKDSIEIWGDGNQVRTYCYIDDCVDGILAVMRSEHTGPFNIGSEETVSITELAEMVCQIAGKKLSFKYVPGPKGVTRRTSNNDKVKAVIGWEPKVPLIVGMGKTYRWIEHMVNLDSGMIQENMK